MNTEELKAWLRLVRAPGIGPAACALLLEKFGSPLPAVQASRATLKGAGLSPAQAEALQNVSAADLETDLDWLAGDSPRGLIPINDARYPAQLREIAHAPAVLFYLGDAELLSLPQLAIVGARSATPQGLENAKAFAGELARRGLSITSGLALGIDGAAHRGALEVDGLTLAVCATGLDRVYPARHQALAREIAKHGVLISEFPTGVEPLAENFPRRNRIIAGLALGTLVVEAALESGSLITARYAMEQGREVFALPGSIHNPLARGCHALIRQGAKLTETADDILQELAAPLAAARQALRALGPEDNAAARGTEPRPSEAEQRLLQALGDSPASLDDLVSRSGLPVPELSALLLQLELHGWVGSASGGRYMRLSSR